ncbi:MAG TPA: ATP-binding cassette domain-containing protein [Rhabdochlamydiaceae bacterium]|jgi:phospholipid/cholesterol/gamma-HCH transport system ATP-binding protein|nr:ATP-binding cassette domain-containing protein [Rhabdochlamydiaceae bacterium]
MIEIRNLKKSFKKSKVLDGVDLDIQKGETLVILGRSGTGKSVLLKHIIGITKPDDGTIDINGNRISDLSGPDLYKAVINMGMLFQGAALFDSMNVEENTGFFLDQHGDTATGATLSEQEIKDRVSHALEMVGLAGTQQKMPSELSGGMRKRAALARLIVYRPSIILYDEPTTGLDPITSMQINELIVKTQHELKATSIVVTHDILSALHVADRLALLDQGKITHIAEPDAFMKIDNPIIEFLRKTITEGPRKMDRT